VFALLAASLLQAPDTLRWEIFNHGRLAGAMTEVESGDTITVRWRYQDRQRGPRQETTYRRDARGTVVGFVTRSLGILDNVPGDVTESAERRDGRWQWRVGRDAGSALAGSLVTGRAAASPSESASGAFYVPSNESPWDRARLAAWLLAQPGGRGAVAPAGRGHAFVAHDTVVTRGNESQRVKLVIIDSLGTAPSSVWLDARGRLFTTGIGWFSPVPRGWSAVLPALRTTEYRFHAERSAALAKALTPVAPTAIAIRNATLFDSETGSTRAGTTVIVTGDRITAVGPDRTTAIPRGARVIDATGRALLPGMWDMHAHVDMAMESDGVLQLAAGVTTIRDMAADTENALSVRARSANGTLLAPRVLLAGFIDGPGFWAGPSDVLARTEDEARATVARYDSLGYVQIKLYNLVHPDLVPTIAAEAKARGMRLSGHIPRGLSVPAAVLLGFDEVQHGAFLFSTFFQDSLYAPRMRAYSNLASEVAPGFDLEAQRFSDLLSFLKAQGTVYDGTFNVYEDASCNLPDGAHPVLGVAARWLPPLEQRGGERKVCDGTTAPQQLQGKYHRALKRLYEAGITLIPGTDNYPGLSYHGELEIYERAGIPAAEVLRIATIVPARVMRQDRDYGSVSVGKVADLVLVDGAPWQRITDLRKTQTVVRGGRVYDVDALYRAVGVTRR
jgi:hypothetical protein